MDRFINILLHGIGIASVAIIMLALASQFEPVRLQAYHVAMPWVLTICSVFMVSMAWIVIHFRKITKRLKALQEVAMTDHLTGVANRMALAETLQGPSVKTALKDGHLAVLSLDLDGFKRLNDEHGHHVGDRALRIAAKRITHSVGRNAQVFRMGGDEFLCLVFDPDPKAAAQTVVDRISASFSSPMDLGGHPQIVAPSVGIAMAQQGETWDAVLMRSDAAMYQAKQSEFLYDFCSIPYLALVEPELRQTA